METIVLKGMKYFAFHGVYPEERKRGNNFEVDLEIQHEPREARSDQLKNTLDYVKLKALVDEEMKHPKNLLESLCELILSRIKTEYPNIHWARVTIKKHQPAGMTDIDAVWVACELDSEKKS